MRVIRVFARKTKACPDDDLAFFDLQPPFYAEGDVVHISVTFDADIPLAERMYKQWRHVAPCSVGGPALGDRGGEFEPGLYLKSGITITSRGCPNRCWFCRAAKNEGDIRELKIKDGHTIQDNNLLACSDQHIKGVFAMLARQRTRPTFSGGLEAARLKQWHVDALEKLKPRQMFFAYDTPDDFEPLVEASKKLLAAGLNRNSMRCYVLIGYPKDTIGIAEKRLYDTLRLGFFPLAMLYHENTDRTWKRIQREWARPAIIAGNCANSYRQSIVGHPRKPDGLSCGDCGLRFCGMNGNMRRVPVQVGSPAIT